MTALFDNGGWTVEARAAFIRTTLPGHVVDVVPGAVDPDTGAWAVTSSETGLVGGYHIPHAAGCPACTPEERAAVRDPDAGYPEAWGPVGRVDVRVLPAGIRKLTFLNVDVPHLLAAVLAYEPPTDVPWPRRDRVLFKLFDRVGEDYGGTEMLQHAWTKPEPTRG